jgi:hypothetical protein
MPLQEPRVADGQQPPGIAPPRPRLVACPACLRVLHESQWVDAEMAIRALRAFERGVAVRLSGEFCDRCRGELRLPRQAAR